MSETWTIGKLLTWTTDYLTEQGSTSPRLDAEILLAQAQGCDRISLYTSFGDVADEEVRAAFRELVKRRAAGEPVAYLVGEREFYSLSFEVSADVLVPRPETEFVVVALLDAVKELSEPSAPLRIADVGTGSGILAVCAAKHIDNCEVTAIDMSPAALEVARRNADRHDVASRIQFLESDLFSAVSPDASFDFVLSNPPYVSDSEMEELARDVRDFEPHLALRAGPDGLDIIRRLVPAAAERLEVGGHLIMEISPMIESRVHELIEAESRFGSPATIKDFAALARVVVAKRV